MVSTTRRRRRLVPAAAPYVLMAPALLLFVVVLLLPILYTLYLSVVRRRVSGLGLDASASSISFVGLDNYAGAVGDPQVVGSIGRVLLYGGILVPTMLGLALLFALLLDVPRTRGTRFARIAIFLPYAVPGVLATLLWGFLYLPDVSPFNDISIALGGPRIEVLGPVAVFPALANIGVWGGVGFNMIVIHTALTSIPSEIIEAARVDGCTELQLARRIKVPLVLPAIILTGVFSIIATLQVFAEPQTLLTFTTSIFQSWAPMMKIYADAFVQNDLFSAAATSILLALGIFVLSFGFLRSVQGSAFREDG